jgi:isopenicillin-N epimerase
MQDAVLDSVLFLFRSERLTTARGFVVNLVEEFMSINRRSFLFGAGTSLVGTSLAAGSFRVQASLPEPDGPNDRVNWSAIRAQFDGLSNDYIHLSSFFLASNPRIVREEIEKHRRAIDDNPFVYVEKNIYERPGRIQAAAAEYLGGKADEVGLTNSTTMGLALIYHGFPLKPGHEILTTAHDHFVHHEAIRLAAERAGAATKKVALFDSPNSATEEEIVARLKNGINSNTRVVGITWVHSSTGVKLPLRAIARMIAEVNKDRPENDRVLTIVDGVHGFGVEDETIAETGVDFFVSGTHKWIFGPRGTGIVWARAENWAKLRMVFPAFARETVTAWMSDVKFDTKMRAAWLNQGGFHSFEYEWALPIAFGFHKQIGRPTIAARIHELNHQCKEGLAAMPNVKLHTPRGNKLSAGLICFEVNGMKPEEVVKRLFEKRIIASTSPYRNSYARLAPSLLNSPEEVDIALRYIRTLA